MDLPFFYLKSDGILCHIAHPGLDSAVESIRPNGVERLNRVIHHAEINHDLFTLMQDRHARQEMRKILLNGDWFLPDEREKLAIILGIEYDFINFNNLYSKKDERKNNHHGRDVRFRLQIIPLYKFSCILCGVKILLPSGMCDTRLYK